MSALLAECPGPPSWSLDWEQVERTCPWLQDLAGCPQDPEFHAEGDVLTHTRLACEALSADPGWRARTDEERAVVLAATLLHDIGKPSSTRREQDGRIGSHGHSGRGEIIARRILWRMGVPFGLREQVAALVRHHQKPFYAIENRDSRRLVVEISQTARCDHLALLAEADARGRVCQDVDRMLENAALFAELCSEQRCLDRPYPFPSDHSRFLYFRSEGRDPEYLAFDDTRCEVVLMSGLPGAGKDHWIDTRLPDLPVVSLDAIRRELAVSPADPQGRVIALARERARDHLRTGRPFVWNGTNLSRRLRAQVIRLFAEYRARVRIVYVEVPEGQLLRQNRARSTGVPEQVLGRLLARWQVPDRTEAHRVEWLIGASDAG